MVPLFLTIGIFLAGISGTLKVGLEKHLRQRHDNTMDQVEALQILQAKSYRQKLQTAVEVIEKDPVLRTAFLERDRGTLLDQVVPLFVQLNRSANITQIYFHEMDKICFLRAHSTNHYGDIVQRETLDEAVVTESEIVGMELGGRGAMTLRLVRPWYHEGLLIGYLELGMEMQWLTADIRRVLDLNIITVLDKTLLTESDWKKGKDTFGYTGKWTDYPGYVIADGSLAKVDPGLHEVLRKGDRISLSRIWQTNQSGPRQLSGLYPLIDFKSEVMGFQIVVWDASEVVRDHSSMFWILILGVFGIGVLILALGYYYLGQVQYDLDSAHEDLTHTLSLQVVATDEAEKMRLKAEASDQIKSNFLANMSHEIRTPMNGVLGMAEILLNSNLNEEQEEYASLVQTSAQSLMIIINDLLDISKIESQNLKLDLRSMDVRSVVDLVTQEIRPEAEEKGLSLTCTVAAEVPEKINCDPVRLKQVVVNLLDNALKFTPVGSVVFQVDLEASENSRSHLRFTVSDTGVGISPQEKDRLFEAFNQADNSTTRHFGGTGLGLAISRQLVTLMGGTLTFKSTEGMGSRFRFTLPVEVTNTTSDPSCCHIS